MLRDETQVQYILSALPVEQSVTTCSPVADAATKASTGDSGVNMGNEDEAVDQIKKILPHLGKGFVKVRNRERERAIISYQQQFFLVVMSTGVRRGQADGHGQHSGWISAHTPATYRLLHGRVSVCVQVTMSLMSYLTNFRLLEEVVQPHLQPSESHSRAPPSTRNEGQVLMEQREGVYDHDEFDVFHRGRNVDLSRVHIGKR